MATFKSYLAGLQMEVSQSRASFEGEVETTFRKVFPPPTISKFGNFIALWNFLLSRCATQTHVVEGGIMSLSCGKRSVEGIRAHNALRASYVQMNIHYEGQLTFVIRKVWGEGNRPKAGVELRILATEFGDPREYYLLKLEFTQQRNLVYTTHAWFDSAGNRMKEGQLKPTLMKMLDFDRGIKSLEIGPLIDQLLLTDAVSIETPIQIN